MANNAAEHINIKIINNAEMLALFNELQTKIQNKIVLNGMRKAATIINAEAKQNLNSVKKGKSKTNYREFNRAFKIEAIKNADNGFGVKVGVKYYKARWIEWGTRDREYKNKNGKMHRTGSIKATNFFYKAVETKKPDAEKMVSECVMDSMKKIISKYEKM